MHIKKTFQIVIDNEASCNTWQKAIYMAKYILDKLTHLHVKIQIINSTRKNIGMYSIKFCAAGLLHKKKKKEIRLYTS